MQPAVVIRLRPAGPWRFGPADGAADRVDGLYSSDRLYSAVTLAMQRLDLLDDWLDATARASRPAVVFSSCFPYQSDTLFAAPPFSSWPPPAPLLTAPNPVFLAKIRWTAARFVPAAVLESMLIGQPLLADQWTPDSESGCLLRRDRPSFSPFRVVLRSHAAVDRLGHSTAYVHSSACVEFEPNSGLWCVARYSDAAAESSWSRHIESAFRLLADSGFGGHRSSGWGQTEPPVFQRGAWPKLLLPKLGRILDNGNSARLETNGFSNYWMLSLYSPAPDDAIDWSGGDYRVTVRTGRIESSVASGARKKAVRMLAEGSVIAANAEPVGAAVDVAPNGFAHPVYRSGFCLALKLPAVVPDSAELGPVETPAGEEVLKPCSELGPSLSSPEEPTPESKEQITNSTEPAEPKSEAEDSSNEL